MNHTNLVKELKEYQEYLTTQLETQLKLNLVETLYAYSRSGTDEEQSILLSDLNLIGTDNWIDLITRDQIEDVLGFVQLKPYQTVWLSNMDYEEYRKSQ